MFPSHSRRDYTGPLIVAAFVSLVITFLSWMIYEHYMGQVLTGTVHDKYIEDEARWWTNESVCVASVPVSCGKNCTMTQCVIWDDYRQEWIDDVDYVLHVLGEDRRGDLKMKRVYVAKPTWSRVERQMQWSEAEFPDQGDTHRRGAREG